MKFRELDTFAIRYAAAADYLNLTIIADCTEPRAEAAARADTPVRASRNGPEVVDSTGLSHSAMLPGIAAALRQE
jgi:hypothetical protein